MRVLPKKRINSGFQYKLQEDQLYLEVALTASKGPMVERKGANTTKSSLSIGGRIFM